MTERIDSHQHFWRYDAAEYPWMGERHAPIKRDMLPLDMQPLLDATRMNGTVAVQARQDLRECAFLLALADEYDFVRGVVGWVDLRADDIEAQLERYAGHPRFVGVRHIVHDEADDRFMLGGGFLRGLAALQAWDLRYDLLLFPRHIRVAIDVVRRFPQQPFVLDHIAKPFIRDGTLQPWQRDIRELAAHDNVFCKVSGMVTEAKWGRWKQADFAPYLDVVFDCFGIERLMFGSDWPVCELAGSYSEVVGIVETYIAALSADEQAAIMGGNAVNFYGLPEV